MPVDRAKRDAMAEALASYLRGEMSHDDIEDALWLVLGGDQATEDDKADRDEYLDPRLWQWHVFRERCMTHENWMFECRKLAFLKTDYQRDRCPAPAYVDESAPEDILLARWHMLGLLVIGGVAYFTSWWFFAAATLISMFFFYRARAKYTGPIEEKHAREQKQRTKYYPFMDEQDWLAHEHLLTPFELPAYDATIFKESSQRKEPASWKTALTDAVIWTVLLFVHLMTAPLWPLCIVMAALSRRKVSEQQTP